MQNLIRCHTVIFDLDGGIPSAQAAAAIKFGLEAVAGVEGAHFAGESVEVVCGTQGVSVDCLLEALAVAGFQRGIVRIRDAEAVGETAVA